MKAAKKTGIHIQVVEFYNLNSCDISLEIRDELEAMAKKFSDEEQLVIFMRVDASHSDVGYTYKLTGYPSYLIFRDGEEVSRLVGPEVDTEMIRSKVKLGLAQPKPNNKVFFAKNHVHLGFAEVSLLFRKSYTSFSIININLPARFRDSKKRHMFGAEY